METHEMLMEKPILLSKYSILNVDFPVWEEDGSFLVVAVVMKGIRIDMKDLHKYVESLTWEEVFAEKATIKE